MHLEGCWSGLKRSQSLTYLGMLFHEDRHIKHAIRARYSKACASVGAIYSRYSKLECANTVQHLVRLQQAILQPSASYGCEVWAPSAAPRSANSKSAAVVPEEGMPCQEKRAS